MSAVRFMSKYVLLKIVFCQVPPFISGFVNVYGSSFQYTCSLICQAEVTKITTRCQHSSDSTSQLAFISLTRSGSVSPVLFSSLLSHSFNSVSIVKLCSEWSSGALAGPLTGWVNKVTTAVLSLCAGQLGPASCLVAQIWSWLRGWLPVKTWDSNQLFLPLLVIWFCVPSIRVATTWLMRKTKKF